MWLSRLVFWSFGFNCELGNGGSAIHVVIVVYILVLTHHLMRPLLYEVTVRCSFLDAAVCLCISEAQTEFFLN